MKRAIMLLGLSFLLGSADMLSQWTIGSRAFNTGGSSFSPIVKDPSVAGVNMAATTSVTSISATTATAVPVGDYVLCGSEAGDNGPGVQFTDNVNGTYDMLGYAVTGSGGFHEYLMVYGKKNTSTATLTITQNFSITVDATGSACDFFTNVNSTKPIDGSLAGAYLDTGTASTTPNIGATFTPAVNNEMVFCPMSTGNPSVTVSAGSGYTLGKTQTLDAYYPEYQIQTTAAGATCPFTVTSSQSYSIGLLGMMQSASSTGVRPYQGIITYFAGLSNGVAPTYATLQNGVSGNAAGFFGPELNFFDGSTFSVSNSHSTITGSTSGPTGILSSALYLPANFGLSYTGNSALNLVETVGSTAGDFVAYNFATAQSQVDGIEYVEWDNSNAEASGHVYDIPFFKSSGSDFQRLKLTTTGSGMTMQLFSSASSPSTAFTGVANTLYAVEIQYNEAGTNVMNVYTGCPTIASPTNTCTLAGTTSVADGLSDPVVSMLWGINDQSGAVSGTHIWFRNAKVCPLGQVPCTM